MANHAPGSTPHDKVDFKDTLNLPRTDFPIRPNAKQDDPALIARWQAEDLFNTSFEHSKGQEQFILHDGPPYANGQIHLGHAYNKIIKDIITKSKRMMGMQVPVTPGWDCHGLPIEIKVSAEHAGSSKAALIKACRSYAAHWVEVQKEAFKNLGVLMQWDKPYLTMAPSYEAEILKAFGQFVSQGYIERKNKTVPWCPSDKTVLASAEIEYEERKDPSIYVLFTFDQATINKQFPALTGKKVDLLVWTTTPWTLPLNRAVLLRPQTSYVVLTINQHLVMIAAERADALCTLMQVEKQVVAECTSEHLKAHQATVHHPLTDVHVPIILDESVLISDGTAAVHCAPGAGPEDYEVGVKNNLEIYCPVDEAGRYTAEVIPTALQGMSVADGQIWVIKQLAATDRLLFKTTIKHSYPICWRCHSGLIFRATKQWFLNLGYHSLKERALEATNHIDTLPEKSINRLQATIEGRLEWCLSRQRIWGVPIAALLCVHCDYAYINQDFINHIAAAIEKDGIEYWTNVDVKELIPEALECPKCHSHAWKKEEDILDVWFDSGISHYAVLYKSNTLRFPADVYIEGKDQHRGWFQSSLLTALCLEKESPMKTIITHGYTVDDKGRKMSKSLGNGISPEEMIEKLGTDGLRLWATSVDLKGEVIVSDVLLKNVQEVYRKIRNTCRFLLSNLYDFNAQTDVLPVNMLRTLDSIALFELYQLNDQVRAAYNRYDFTAVFHHLSDYCAVNLSTLYLDMVKDTLYVESADGHARRSVQTTCYYILDTLTKLIAPVLSFTAELISDQYQQEKKSSIHLQSFATVPVVWHFDKYPEHMEHIALLKQIRSAVMQSIEKLREQDVIKRSLDAQLIIFIDEKAPWFVSFKQWKQLIENNKETLAQFFKDFLIVSQISFATNAIDAHKTALEGLYVEVKKADGDKCPRCWQWEVTTHPQKLCRRCAAIVDRLRK